MSRIGINGGSRLETGAAPAFAAPMFDERNLGIPATRDLVGVETLAREPGSMGYQPRCRRGPRGTGAVHRQSVAAHWEFSWIWPDRSPLMSGLSMTAPMP
jgi:hypothetical protein